MARGVLLYITEPLIPIVGRNLLFGFKNGTNHIPTLLFADSAKESSSRFAPTVRNCGAAQPKLRHLRPTLATRPPYSKAVNRFPC
jgi:hypothetical protein